MPFSSVLGANSVIKPGVCTSTTRPTVPYTGQLIFETDTTRLAVWTGSAWQYETAAAGPPGLVYLTGASFTTATSFSLPNSTFTSAYTNYRMHVVITAVTSDADFSIRMRVGGSDNSTNSYERAGIQCDSSTSTLTALNAANQTSFDVGEQDASFIRYRLALDIMTPELTQPTMIYGNVGYVNKAASSTFFRNVNGVFTGSTSFDSLSFISSVSSSITGSYRVYGYATS